MVFNQLCDLHTVLEKRNSFVNDWLIHNKNLSQTSVYNRLSAYQRYEINLNTVNIKELTKC